MINIINTNNNINKKNNNLKSYIFYLILRKKINSKRFYNSYNLLFILKLIINKSSLIIYLIVIKVLFS